MMPPRRSRWLMGGVSCSRRHLWLGGSGLHVLREVFQVFLVVRHDGHHALAQSRPRPLPEWPPFSHEPRDDLIAFSDGDLIAAIQLVDYVGQLGLRFGERYGWHGNTSCVGHVYCTAMHW